MWKEKNICVEYETLIFWAVTGLVFCPQGHAKTSNPKMTPLEFTSSPCKLFFFFSTRTKNGHTNYHLHVLSCLYYKINVWINCFVLEVLEGIMPKCNSVSAGFPSCSVANNLLCNRKKKQKKHKSILRQENATAAEKADLNGRGVFHAAYLHPPPALMCWLTAQAQSDTFSECLITKCICNEQHPELLPSAQIL